MKRPALLLCLVALVACGDTDGDGLSDAREERLGSDPKVADTDGDGLNDGDEVDAGVDPVLWDTDGDGYSDFEEIHFGSDPLDVTSAIYAGGWPYNPFKGDLEDPGLDARPSLGDRVGRWKLVDTFGEEVDLYDYAGHDADVMIDLSAMWCGPCKTVSSWLDGNNPAGFSEWNPVREAVESGDLLWITVITEDNQGNFPDDGELAQWADRYPDSHRVAVLKDVSGVNLARYWDNRFYPALYLLDSDLEFVKGPNAETFVPALDAALARLEAE